MKVVGAFYRAILVLSKKNRNHFLLTPQPHIFMKKIRFTPMILSVFISLAFLFSCTQDVDLASLVLENQEDEGNPVIDGIVSSGLKAFPDAYGSGAGVDGFRGGEVLHITTLEDDVNNVKEGTLRWALTREYPRIIVFDVSGTIHLNGMIFLNSKHSNFYLAGQTSPNGIMVRGYAIWMDATDQSVVRYVKFYGDPDKIYAKNDPSSAKRPSVAFTSPGQNIIDHCSFVFNANEGVNFWAYDRGTKSIGQTLQNCIVGEGDTGVLMGGDEEDKVAGEVSAIRNLFVHIRHRTPNVTGGAEGEVINNVVYNWRTRLTRVSRGSTVNYAGNYIKQGSASTTTIRNRRNIIMQDPDTYVYLDPKNWSYVEGIYEGTGSQSDIFTATYSGTHNTMEPQPPVSNWLVNEPFPMYQGVRPEIMSSFDAYDHVLNNAGARRYLNADGTFDVLVDSKDEQYITDIQNKSNKNGKGAEYGNELGFFDFPEIAESKRPANYDTDKDGMPDVWEKANGLDPNRADDSEDKDGDGYTNIEEFINLVDKK